MAEDREAGVELARRGAAQNEPKMEQDPVQKAMGALGKWHIFVCCVVFLLKFPVAWHQIGIVFLAPPVSFSCILPNNTTLSDGDKCNKDCIAYEYDRSIFKETITTQWDLVCDKAQLPNLSQTLVMLGILTGNVIFGTLADKFGRRGPMVAAVFIQLLSGVATSFAPNFWLFCVFRFITAIATGGSMVTSFVLVMEIIGAKWRELFSVLYQIPFNAGHLLLAVFGYYFRDWRHLQFAISIPSVILISYYWLVPESPRWLFAVGRVDDACKILEKAAKMNKLPTENIRGDLELNYNSRGGSSNISKGNVWDLYRTPNLRKKTICICFNWFVCGLAFFGLAQYIGQTGGDIFVNVAISASLTLPGTVVCIYCMKVFGRKKTLITSNTLTGIVMLAIAFVPSSSTWTVISLASIGIFGMSISFPTVYLYAGELFPTVVRNVGIGTASMIARIGSMVAPFVAGMSASRHWLPPVIFGVIPLIGAILVIFLPETKGAPLPETIEDGERFGKKVKNPSTVENGK